MTGAVRRHAQVRPDAVAVDEAGMALTYGDLAARAAGLQRALQEAAAAPGGVVAAATYGLGDLAVATVATAGLGMTVYPMDLTGDLTQRVELVAASAVVLAGFPSGTWTADRVVVHLDEVEPAGDLVDGSVAGGLAVESERHDAVVLLTGAGIGASARAFVDRLGLTARDRTLVVGLPNTDVAVLGMLAALSSGGTAVPAGRPVVEGDRLRRIIERHRVTVLVTAPRAAAILADAAADGGIQLSGLRTILLVRDRVPARLTALLDQVTPRHREVVVGWGSAETGIITAIGPAGADAPGGLPDGEWIRAGVGEHGVAEIWCGGPVLSAGYIARPDLDRRLYVKDPDGRRWYRTGPVDPHGIERVIEARGGVRMACVVATAAGEMVAFVEPSGGSRVDIDALRAHLRENLPDGRLPAQVISVPALPITASGAVDRDRLIARARVVTAAAPAPAADRLDTTAETSSGGRRILRTVADELGVANLGPWTNLFEVGATSLEIIRAVSQVQVDLDFDIDLEALLDAPYVQTLIDQYEECGRSSA